MLRLEKYSIGVGDRFARQAKAQLKACMLASEQGIDVVPVWNKSFREHGIVGSAPESVRKAADRAVSELGWKRSYYVDADHINLDNVMGFLTASDFFTIDVAAMIGQPHPPDAVDSFVRRHPELEGRLEFAGLAPVDSTRAGVALAAKKYFGAVVQAGRIYRLIESQRGEGSFITEVSMDETDAPQTPAELMVILAALADQRIPVQTIAPKFTGRFNKGVDFVGDPAMFEAEFRADVAVIAEAVKRYGLPDTLKLSVHSGSDKFSIYPAIQRTLAETGAGVHLKTAGTTWLEEIIGLAEAGGPGLALAKEVYAKAYKDRAALCEPYAAVIDIDPAQLPEPSVVAAWTTGQLTAALRHDQSCLEYNPHMRQLLHVGYKVAAKMGHTYLDLLAANEAVVGRNVTANLLDRHILRIYPRTKPST